MLAMLAMVAMEVLMPVKMPETRVMLPVIRDSEEEVMKRVMMMKMVIVIR